MQKPDSDERFYVADEAILGAFFKLSRLKKPLAKSQYLTSSKLQVLPEAPFIIITRISPRW